MEEIGEGAATPSSLTDPTRRVEAEEQLRLTMEHSPIGLALESPEGRFVLVNPALCRMLGRDAETLQSMKWRDLTHPDDVEFYKDVLADLMAGRIVAFTARKRYLKPDGSMLWGELSASCLRNEDGSVRNLITQIVDVSAQIGATEELGLPALFGRGLWAAEIAGSLDAAEDLVRSVMASASIGIELTGANEALAYQAVHDSLTGLHNRTWVMDTLKADLGAAQRAGTSVGMLFVDLDNFRVINESLGHAAGDEVLTTVANRIGGAVRPQDRVGRFGGDEFVVVIQDVRHASEVERFAEQLSAVIAVDVPVQGHRIVPTSSIGITLSTSESTPESLLRESDSAMHRAKAAGRARWHSFDDAMHAQAVARLTLEGQLRDAITAGEFVVHYQPIVALADSHIVGHEALVRWAHPTRGLLSPGEFLDVAEDTGLIHPIGAQVLDQACAMLAARPDLPGPISVNVSAVQLGTPDWLSSVVETLNRHVVDPVGLVIEITETAALSMTDTASEALESLRRLGVGIHLDDFGTGYSSISVLRDVPVTGVKLDIRFVHDLTPGPSIGNALVHGLSELVKDLHLTGIAEGIETQMQADILRSQGWLLGQGFHFGLPAPQPSITPARSTT